MTRPPGRLVDIGGRRLHARLEGAGDQLVVLESGGGGGSSVQDWPVQRRVARYARCLSYDRAGFGGSDPSPEPRRLEAMADDLAALLDALGADAPVILVAGSFGGLVAQAFALGHPQRLAGLVLVDCCDVRTYVETMQSMRTVHEAELVQCVADAGNGKLARDAASAIEAARGLTHEERAAMLAILNSPSHFEAARRELEVLDGAPLPDFATPLAAPLAVITHGRPYEREMAIWERGWTTAQHRLLALSRRSAQVVARSNGHAIASENPRLVAEVVRCVADACRTGASLDLSSALAGI